MRPLERYGERSKTGPASRLEEPRLRMRKLPKNVWKSNRRKHNDLPTTISMDPQSLLRKAPEKGNGSQRSTALRKKEKCSTF
jgi:hypothetical protein